MNAAGSAPGLDVKDRYRGDGCLNTAVDPLSGGTVLATEGRSDTTPTWTWSRKSMGTEVDAITGKVTGTVIEFSVSNVKFCELRSNFPPVNSTWSSNKIAG